MKADSAGVSIVPRDGIATEAAVPKGRMELQNVPIMRAIVVDDDEIGRRLLARALSAGGFDVLAFDSGEGCLDAIGEFHPEVILLDVMMPQVDGYSLCRQIKNDDRLQDVPVLFLTALSQVKEKVLAFEVGAADFICKPFDHRELLARARVHAELFAARRKIQDYASSLESLVDQRTRMLINADRLVTLGTMSAKTLHDMQNCLTYVFGNIDLARAIIAHLRREDESIDDAECRETKAAARAELWSTLLEALADTRSGVERVEQTANGLRRYSRGISSEMIETVRLDSIIQNAIQIVGPRVRNILTFVSRVPATITITCNRRLMEQVFVNLMSNAADAMEGTKGSITVSAEQADREVWIRFEDDGPGIPDEIRGQIFEPFFTTKGEESGTGLGLAIVREIIDGLQGRIRLSDNVSSGACFEIHLPRRSLGTTP